MKLESIIPRNRDGSESCSGGTAAWGLSAGIVFLCMFGLQVAAGAAEIIATNDYSAVDAVFSKHCLECHEAKDPEANLVLESFESLIKGSENGAVIVPGNSAESLVIKMIEGRVEKEGKKKIMPPGKRKKLDPEEIALLRSWIDAGAKPPSENKVRELAVPKIAPKVPPSTTLEMAAPRRSGRFTSAAAKRPRATAAFAIPIKTMLIRKRTNELTEIAYKTRALPSTPIDNPSTMLLRLPIFSIRYPQADAAKAPPRRYTPEGTPA